jgi:glutaconate CoA-transferase subunit A
VTAKLITIEEAASRVLSGSTLAIGGFTSQRHPTALLRQLVRNGVRDLAIYAHSAGSEVDLLIGAGCVRRVEAAYLADGLFAPIAPNWRRFVEAGRIEFEDYSNAAMMARFSAAAMGLPFLPIRSMIGSDLLLRAGLDVEARAADPQLAPFKYVRMACPFSGEPVVLVPAVRPDVCLLHVQKASRQGLLRIEGQEFLDVQMALASRCVIATCEELVDDALLRRDPDRNRIPPFAVDGVVEVPFGAHPHSVHNYYDYDPRHLEEYGAAATSDATFADYLHHYVYAAGDHAGYLAAIGGQARLDALAAAAEHGYNPLLDRVRGGQ